MSENKPVADETSAYVHLEEAYEAGKLPPELVPRLLTLRNRAAQRFDLLEPELRVDSLSVSDERVKSALRRVVQMQGENADVGEVQYIARHLR